MDLALYHKRAIVTGGSKGIGRAVAATLVQEGALVLICARSEETLNETKNAIHQKFGQSVLTVVADLSSQEGADKVRDVAMEEWGGVDILVNNAGAAPGALIEELSDDIWHQALNVKFLGYVRMMKAILPVFKEQRKGVVVNVVGNDGIKFPYWELTGTAANAADLAVSQALALQYGRYNIRINSVNPGPVDTGRWDNLIRDFASSRGITPEQAHEIFLQSLATKRIATPQEVADITVFLSSPKSSFINGAAINVDGNQQKSIIDYLSPPPEWPTKF